jgi:hypothetical protein
MLGLYVPVPSNPSGTLLKLRRIHDSKPLANSLPEVLYTREDGCIQSMSLPMTHVRTVPPTHIWEPSCSM